MNAVADVQRFMETTLGASLPHATFVTAGPVVAALHTDAATTERLRLYIPSVVDAFREWFPALAAEANPTVAKEALGNPVKLYVWTKKEELKLHKDRLCGTAVEGRSSMGFYFAPARSGLVSMEWGLGWVGDIILRAFFDDEWHGASGAPKEWFQQGLQSMLYNSFRTADGRFEGFNVASYYRPQAQRLVDQQRIVPLTRFLSGDYREGEIQDNALRVQGREFLAYLFAQGMLVKFCRRYRETYAKDPSGIKAVEEALGAPLANIETSWLEWLMGWSGEIGNSAMGKPFPVLGVLIKRRLGTESGVEITPCLKGPADRAGFQPGDRITQAGDTPISTQDDLLRVLAALPINTTLPITGARTGREFRVPVLLDRFIDG